MDICAFTAVCEEDSPWIGQYLDEVERLGVLFAIHLDRCSTTVASCLTEHRSCVGHTKQDDLGVEFTEKHKQGAMDLAAATGVGWLLSWDIDEVWELSAVERLRSLPDADHIQVGYMTLWEDYRHARIDGQLRNARRVKLYNRQVGLTWKFMHKVVNGPKPFRDGRPASEHRLASIDLRCLHCGLMTDALRRQHKARWDRVYTAAVGVNPYGLWDYVLNPDVEPEVVEL